MNEDKYNQKYIESDDEITLKELILKLKEYFREIMRKWWLMLLIIIPIITYNLYKAYSTIPVYPAALTFMLNDDDGGGMGGISAILGQFGFGGGSKGKFNTNKLLELSRSRRIVQMALFEKVSINKKNDYLANHIILEYDYHETWEEYPSEFKNFLFTHDSIPIFNRTENNVLKSLHGHIIGYAGKKGLSSIGINNDSGIMTLSASTHQEELSIKLTEILYENLSNFYVNKTIEKQLKTYQLFKSKTDSIQQTLNNVQYRLLRFKDTNRSLTLRQYEAEEIKLQREIQKLILAYGEAYKNLEIADFSLKNKTPFIQIIDSPIYPITPIRTSKLMAIIYGLIFGGIISILLIIGRKIINDTLNS